MPRRFTHRLVWVLLLPLLLLLSGGPAGAWHCADGSPCERSTALTCCCGCPEGAAASEHQCGVSEPQLTGETCGCYFEATQFQSRQPAGPVLGLLFAALPVPCATWILPPAVASWGPPPLEIGDPPRHLSSPHNPRGPPSA